MFTNIASTNRVGFKILAKVNLILRPHYTSDIENQANPKIRFTNMAFNKRGQIEDAEIPNAHKLWSRSFCSAR